MSRRLESLAVDGTHFLFPVGENYGLYLDDAIDGLDAPEYAESSDPLSGENGDVINSALYRGRNIVIRGHVYSNTDAQYEELRKVIVGLGSIRKNSYGDVELKKLEFWTKGGGYYWTYATIRHSIPWDKHTLARWMLFCHCPDPFIRSDAQTLGPITRPLGGGAMIPATVPFTVSSGGGGVINIYNYGSAPAYPVWTLQGPLNNPRIALGSQAFKLNIEMEADDEVVIDTDPAAQTVIRNGSDNIITLVDSTDYDFFALDPGENVIQFSTSESSDTGTLTVDTYTAHLGI